MENQNLIKLIVDKKCYAVSEKMAMATINLAKEKYKKENINAIVAVQKNDMIVMQKEVHEHNDAFEKSIKDWETSGYKCYFTTKKG